MKPIFNDAAGIAKALCMTLLTAHIGKMIHPTRPEEERIDIPQAQFNEIAELAKAYLKATEK